MSAYAIGAAAAWFLGFAPFVGLYIAIPAAVALGLDYVSALVWASFGNFTPILLIVLGFERLQKLPRIGPWLEMRTSERFRTLADRYGMLLVLFATPIIGAWPLAVTGVSLGMNRYRLAVFSGVSIVLYAVVIAVGVALGVEMVEAVTD